MLPQLTRDEVDERLTLPEPSKRSGEQPVRSWTPDQLVLFDCPLLRNWDFMSGSIPNVETGRMVARHKPRELCTKESRQHFLKIHINNGDWRPTPFISFTKSAEVLQELADFRRERRFRQTQHVIVINPNVRIRQGLPLLSMEKEMKQYEVPNPYGPNTYETDHYICLWEVNEEEIVGQWTWDELRDNENWYQDIVMPAYRLHEAAASQSARNNQVATRTFDMSDLAAALSDEPTGSSESRQMLRHPHTAHENFHLKQLTLGSGSENSEVPFTQLYHGGVDNGTDDESDDANDVFDEQEWSDTDDEVEESNAADDMIKMIEGLW